MAAKKAPAKSKGYTCDGKNSRGEDLMAYARKLKREVDKGAKPAKKK